MAKEQEKKIEERKKILTSEWDDEEDGEAEVEEKKKMKQNLGDDADADNESEAESDQEAYFQDDNIQGKDFSIMNIQWCKFLLICFSSSDLEPKTKS